MRTLIPLLLACLAIPALHANAATLRSGQAVPVGTADQIGPFSVGLNNHPIAAIKTSKARPDILVATGPHSPKNGLFYASYAKDAPDGTPIFENAVAINAPMNGKNVAPSAIWQSADGTVHAFWLQKNKIRRTTLDTNLMRFEDSAPAITLKGFPRNPNSFTAIPNPDGSLILYFAVSDGARRHPEDNSDWRSAGYRPYDGGLIYRGGLAYFAIYSMTLKNAADTDIPAPMLASTTEKEVLLGVPDMTSVYLDKNSPPALLVGTRQGNLLHYSILADSKLSQKTYVADTTSAHVALRSPTINPAPIAYPNKDGIYCDIIAGGEGPLSYYGYTGEFTKPKNPVDAPAAPIYTDPKTVLQTKALLYPNSLPVLSAIDWDGDGVTDLISGNSDGQILLFKNIGSDHAPAFDNAIPLEAAGKTIQIQQAYVNVQGPGEQRWGYSCPSAFDWNGDGLPDIVTSSATAKHQVYLNSGTKTAPKLDAPLPLYCDGLDVHGTWRTQPAVAKIGDRTAYIALDDQDELHLYWRIDNQNLRDAGKLLLDDGSAICANFLKAGGTGRLKLQLVDWDMDGKLDLLIGTPRHGSVPNPKTGLPQSLGLKGAAVLFLKNVGTNDNPVYKFPVLMKHKGQPIYHHQHACSPVATYIGKKNPNNAPNLFVGTQEGTIYYYDRDELSWD